MSIVEGKFDNKGVSIHYIENGVEADAGYPLVIIPGFTESAEDYLDIIKQFDDRRMIVISFRGRGKSDAPETGYTLEDHVGDIEAVTQGLSLDAFIILGYSRGVSYMLDYSLKHLQKIKGIIIADYPGMHTRLMDNWVEMFISLPPWRGRTALERMPRHAIEAIQRESVEKKFYEALKEVKVPVLLLKGDQKGSLLSAEAQAQYTEVLENLTVATIEGCSHDLFKPSDAQFVQVVKTFVNGITE